MRLSENVIKMIHTIKSFFIHPPSWFQLRGIGNSAPAKLSILVPIIGYFIIFNDSLVHHLNLSRFYIGENEPANSYRLFFIYFGLCFIGFSSLIFQIFCPEPFKFHSHLVDYVEREINIISEFRIHQIVKRIQKFYDEIINNDHPMTLYEKETTEAAIRTWESFTNNSTPSQNDFDMRESEKIHDRLHHDIKVEALKAYWLVMNGYKKSARRIVSIGYLIGLFLLSIPTIDTFVKVCIVFANLLSP